MPYARHPFRCDYYPGAVLATDPIQKGLLHKAVLLRGVVEITPGETRNLAKSLFYHYFQYSTSTVEQSIGQYV